MLCLCLEHYDSLIRNNCHRPPALATKQSSRMSRFSRSARSASDSYNFDGILDPSQVSDDDIRMQQALLEAVGRVQTPTSPSVGRSSRRASSQPPAYDPAQPNAREDAVLYNPTAWGTSSGDVERRWVSSQTQGSGAARSSPTSTAYSPRSRPQRQQQQYDPSSPMYARPPKLYDPSDAGRSPTASGEPSPGYSPYGAYGGYRGYGGYGDYVDYRDLAHHSYVRPYAAIVRLQRRVTGVMEALEDYQTQVDARMDRVEARLAAISDLLAEQIEAQQANEDASSHRKKRKRPSDKKVSFDTSADDSDAPTTPSKKSKTLPNNSPAPRTPRKQQAVGQPKTPRAPRKAAPRRAVSQDSSAPPKKATKVASSALAFENAAEAPETDGALRRSARVRKRT